MKKIVCFLLAVSLMLSLSVFSFATPVVSPIPDDVYLFSNSSVSRSSITPYSLIPPSTNPYILTYQSGSSGQWVSLIDENGLLIGSGGILGKVGSDPPLNNGFMIKTDLRLGDYGPNYWWNFIGRVTDANGYVLKSTDINYLGLIYSSEGTSASFGYSIGGTSPASDNLYQFDDGFFQVSLSSGTPSFNARMPSCLFCNVSNTSVVAPLSFEVEVFDFYGDESSLTVKPFVFGSGAHVSTPPTPVIKDPNDHTQYGDASDQVEWYNDAYGSAVDPALEDKMSATTDMLLQEQEIEEQMIDGINQYAPAVDPANLSMPTQILNGLSFIGTTFMGSYNALGDIGFVISFSMMLGVVLVLIGRGEGALARGMASSARAERNRIAEEKRVMYERRRYGQERNR